MERAILRLTPENFITVGILSAVAYMGVMGAQMIVAKAKAVQK